MMILYQGYLWIQAPATYYKPVNIEVKESQPSLRRLTRKLFIQVNYQTLPLHLKGNNMCLQQTSVILSHKIRNVWNPLIQIIIKKANNNLSLHTYRMKILTALIIFTIFITVTAMPTKMHLLIMRILIKILY